MPLFQLVAPNSITSLTQLGKAMIRVGTSGYDKNIIEVKDIKVLSA
jgi:hypothetical protein